MRARGQVFQHALEIRELFSTLKQRALPLLAGTHQTAGVALDGDPRDESRIGAVILQGLAGAVDVVSKSAWATGEGSAQTYTHDTDMFSARGAGDEDGDIDHWEHGDF